MATRPKAQSRSCKVRWRAHLKLGLCPRAEPGWCQLDHLWQNFSAHSIARAFVSTARNSPADVAVPVVRELRAVLDTLSRDHLTFIATASGAPFSAAGIGNWFRRAIRAAGLSDKLSMHGLRKAAARSLAEAGCTTHEIASITGHKTLSEIERYTREAELARLARTASGMVVQAFGEKSEE